MRMKKYWMGLLCGALVAGSASAAAINVNGQWDDWFGNVATPPDEWPNPPAGLPLLGSLTSAGGEIYVDDSGADANNPGIGGQPYDAEQFVYYAEGGSLYIGLITGFSPDGVLAPGTPGIVPGLFQAGDLFVDLDTGDNGGVNGTTYDFAVGLSRNNAGYGSSVRSGLVYSPNSAAGFYAGSGDTLLVEYPQHQGWVAPDADPFRATTTGTPAIASVAYGQYGSHWFYEICISGVGPTTTGLGLHWTMECGNDYIRMFDPSFTIPETPVVPVPAAAPIALLGMGIVALVSRKRRTIDC